MGKLFYGLSAFLVLFALLSYFRIHPLTRRPAGPESVATSPQSPSLVAPRGATAATSPSAADDPDYAHTPNQKFKVLKSDSATGDYQFQLDARSVQELPLVPNAAGEIWTFSLAGKACAYAVPCFGPDGNPGKPMYITGTDRVKMSEDEFPVQDAQFQAAIAFAGNARMELGKFKVWTVPAEAVGQRVSVGYNIRPEQLPWATGGGVLTLKIKNEQTPKKTRNRRQ